MRSKRRSSSPASTTPDNQAPRTRAAGDGEQRPDEPPYWRMLYGDVDSGSALPARPPAPKERAAPMRRAVRRRWLLVSAAAVALLAAALLAPPLLGRLRAARDPIAAAVPGTIEPTTQAAFDAAWARADLPVQLGDARRGWIWGPEPVMSGLERYAGAPDGMRAVQYYDKGRLELNDPARTGLVSSGLLVRELVTGMLALGDDPGAVERRRPAGIAIAGDASTDNPAPSYADFGALLEKEATARIGAAVPELLARGGGVGALPTEAQGLAAQATIAAFDGRTGRNIPQVFWSWFAQHGPVFEADRIRRNQPLFAPWEVLIGLPLTEPYWVAARIDGRQRWVLTQLFERRVLTFTPDNAPEFRVEMGNTGRHYWQWRYGRPADPQQLLQAAEVPGELSERHAAVNWSSDRPLAVEVVYQAMGDGSARRVAAGVQSAGAAVVLDELQAGTRYVWRAVGTDAEGNIVRSPARSFRTPGAPPPGIAGKVVCLTFDDGPTQGTADVLDALAGMPATFFLVGSSMGGAPQQQRALVERMLREGHQIANHTLTHMPMLESAYRSTYGTLADDASRERFRANLAENETHFQRLLNTGAQLFYHARLPGDGGIVQHDGAAIYADAARALGLAYVHWNVELAPAGRLGQLWASDWQGIAGVSANTAELPPPGAIVLLHDAHFAGRADLLRAIVDRLAANGYSFGRLDSAGGCTDTE